MSARILWTLGVPFRLVLLVALAAYRRLVSPLLTPRCRFHPSCSAYAEQAIRVHGAAKGSLLAGWRVARCSPLSAGGPDPVPARGRWSPGQYDNVIPGEA